MLARLRAPLAVLCALPLLAVAHRGDDAQAANRRAPWVDPSPHHVRHVVVAPGVQLEVLDWGGRGQPLVFLAGYGNSAHVFDGFAPQFRDRYRVVAITRRGFGSSTLATAGYDNATLVRDVVRALDSLHIVQPVLVGHSFGGAELTGIATLHPRLARAVVYLDGGFDFAELYADSLWIRTPMPRPPRPAGIERTMASEAAYLSEMTGPGYPEAEVRSSNASFEVAARTPAFHADSLATWLQRGTPPATLRAIRVPAVAIYGVPATVAEKYPWYSRSPAGERQRAEHRFAVERSIMARQRARFRRDVPQAKIIEIPGGRHYIFLTHPQAVARAIRNVAP